MSYYPLPLYLASAALMYFLWRAFSRSREAWGIPACAVLVTAAVWYVGDAVYNDYGEFSQIIGPEHVVSACWQLLLFVVAFGLMVEPVHHLLNSGFQRQRSFAVHAYRSNVLDSRITQKQIDQVAVGLAIAWVVLMGIGLVRVDWDALGLFAPYLSGEKAEPWARGRIGEGFEGLLSLAGYVQILLTSAIGVVFALSSNPRTRVLAGLLFFLSAPYFIFDRARNTMLAALLPAILAWVVLRVKANLAVKGALLGVAFFVISSWFSFIIANRTDLSISSALTKGVGVSGKETRHDGLNMLEELAWMDSFVVKGTYRPNWGQRYFAEVVNPIPRSLWSSKPTIGIDYALARGMGASQASNREGGIAASIATGMIGQGVANFGRFFGPLAAAGLMSLWVALLARQDLLSWKEPVRLLLYGNGLVLTFNMGRDITLLVIYPFFFGVLFFWGWSAFRRAFIDVKATGFRQQSRAAAIRNGRELSSGNNTIRTLGSGSRKRKKSISTSG